jgi:glutathionyl-hydroquinone reductase
LNLAFISNYPNITAYMERLGNIPAFADTLDIEASKEGYFLSWNQPTNGLFVPAGPVVNAKSGVAVRASIMS